MLLLILSCIIVVYSTSGYFYRLFIQRKKLPPGPIPLPIIGNLHTMIKKDPGYDAFLDWKKEYGPVYTHFFGSMPLVSITSYELLKKYIVNQGHVFSDRHHFEAANILFRGGNFGIIEADGELWRIHRRFAISALRDFGMGKSIMEEKIQHEIEQMNARIKSHGGQISAESLYVEAVGNIINSIVFGDRFEQKHIHELYALRETLTKLQLDMLTPMSYFLLTFPFLKAVPPFSGLWNRLQEYKSLVYGLFTRQIEKVTQNVDFDSDEYSNLVEAYLKEQKKREHEPEFGTFTKNQLQSIVLDFWFAGLETTIGTLMWGTNYLLRNPDVMQKMHKELDKLIGRGNTVRMSNKPQLHYCNAVISEIQRFLNFLPQNLFRKTTEDIEVEGYLLPKGTVVLPQISCVLYDEKIFPNPREFNPARFLNEDGTYRTVSELVPFSMGKRQCAGEGLARMELFLFFINLIHKFELSVLTELPSIQRTFKTIIKVPDYEIVFAERL